MLKIKDQTGKVVGVLKDVDNEPEMNKEVNNKSEPVKDSEEEKGESDGSDVR